MRLSVSTTAPAIARVPRLIGWWLPALLAMCLASGANAEVRDFYFQHLGSERGLTQNTVTALAQDAQGFVWVGTQGGLHRYDGQRFLAWRHDPRDPAGLPDSFITALSVESGRALWIGTYSQYVVRLDLGDGSFRHYATTEPDSDGGPHVRALLAHGGQVWVGSRLGLERLDPDSGQRSLVLRLPPHADNGLRLQSLQAGADGMLWYASPAGLHRIGPEGRIERIGPAQAVLSLARDHRGRLWVGREDGLYRLRDDGRGLARVWPAPADPGVAPAAAAAARTAPIHAIVEAPDRHLWLSVFGQGLLRLDPETGFTQAIREQQAIAGTLPENSIATLMIDRGGLLWVGGRFRGTAIADPRGARFSYLVNLDSTTGMGAAADSSVRSIAQSDDGALWIGTDTSHLLRYDPAQARFQDLTARLPGAATGGMAQAPPRVMGFAEAGPHRLWLATSQGLMRLDTATRQAVAVAVALPGQPSPNLRSIARDARGGLWLGSNGRGLLHYRPDNGALRHYPLDDGSSGSLNGRTVHALLVDRRGRVWIATGDGLGLLEPGSGRVRRFRHVRDDPHSLAGNLVRALHQSRDGSLWIGSHAGLSRVREAADGKIRFDQPLAAALDDGTLPTVYSIAESPPGHLWLGTDAGILRFRPGHDRVRSYGLADGLQDIEFNGGAATVLADGRLAFGGVRGLNLFDPARLADSGYMPPLRLLAAHTGARSSTRGDVLWRPDRLVVPGGADLLRLRIGALDFAPAADIRYRYRMDGFDQDWIDNGARDWITYTRLPPGDYQFRAQASNRDGVWNPAELRLPVQVLPPAWRHPLALAGYALAALLILATLGWQWRRRRRRERGYFEQIREREERLKLALWASGEQFWDYDLAHGELHWMRAGESSGETPEIGMHTAIDDEHEIHDEDLPQVRERLRQHMRGASALFLSEHRIRRPDGGWTWVRARGRVVDRDRNGRALRIAGTARDITLSRRADRERRIASEVLRSMAEAVAVFDRDFRFVSINPAFARMTGYAEADVVGHPTGLLDSAQHDPEFYRSWRSDLQRNGRWSGEMWQRRKDGDEFLCRLQSGAVQDASGERVHYVAVLGDITDQKRAEQELRYMANYDTLTNLPNRTLLSERLSQAIVRARRQRSRVAVLFLDLDRFKDINDSLGHAVGDRILRAAAARVQQAVGARHTVARLGGDEFTVVLEDLDAAEEAEKVARDVIVAFEVPLEIDDQQDVSVSPSIGISLYPDNAQGPIDLLKHADTAMYQAKAAGRRTYMRYAESMDVEIRRRATIAGALRKVLDRDELKLVFQPRLSLPQARITGVETLLRWTSPEHGEIPPAQFIPLAEESGLILEIGEWVLREACFTLKQWRQLGLDRLSMSVNVSSLQLLRGNLPSVVARVLGETGVPAECLELELTESVIMANAEHTMTILQAFRSLGVSLAIDDFGTGYSSLAYLKRLPITTLKIDKEFIGDLTRDPDDEAITSTVIAMAHSLELNVVAEGVENEAQVQFLRQHRCDEIQGYWLSPPLEPQRCLEFLRGWSPTAAPGPAAPGSDAP